LAIRVFTRFVLCAAIAFVTSETASALNVPGTRVRLAWSAASGPVAGYVVEVSRNAGAFVEESRVAATAAYVTGSIGQTLSVRVRAYDANGRLGSPSASSGAFTFVSATGATADLDGNGLSDAIAVNRTSGAINAVLLMSNGSRSWVAIGSPRDPAMRPAGFSDVDGDGRSDLVFRNSASGANELWLMRGLTYAVVALPPQAARFRVAAVRDFSGDGKADVFFHDAATGQSVVWTLSGGGLASVLPVDPAPPGAQLAAIADVDGDRAPDLVWQRTATRSLEVWILSGVRPRAAIALGVGPANARVVGVGDLDRNGCDDLVWSTPAASGATLRVWFLAGTSAPRTGVALVLTSPSVFRGVVDANSNGRDDLLIGDAVRIAYEVSPVRVSGSTTRWQTSAIPLGRGPSGGWQFIALD
jgi:hypothetical protein